MFDADSSTETQEAQESPRRGPGEAQEKPKRGPETDQERPDTPHGDGEMIHKARYLATGEIYVSSEILGYMPRKELK